MFNEELLLIVNGEGVCRLSLGAALPYPCPTLLAASSSSQLWRWWCLTTEASPSAGCRRMGASPAELADMIVSRSQVGHLLHTWWLLCCSVHAVCNLVVWHKAFLADPS